MLILLLSRFRKFFFHNEPPKDTLENGLPKEITMYIQNAEGIDILIASITYRAGAPVKASVAELSLPSYVTANLSMCGSMVNVNVVEATKQ